MALIAVERFDVRMAAGRREVHALRGVSIAVEAGERLTIVGESGSGKSTLLLALLGLLPRSAIVSGQVTVDGVDVLAGPDADLTRLRWRQAALVFQASANPLNPVRTVGHQLRAVLMLHGETRAAARHRIRELLDLVRLPAGCERAYPHQLSGGMRQRAVLALAIACRPSILFADEPTTALDPIVQAEIMDLMESLRARFGLTLVLVTHDLALARRSGGTLAVMLEGAIVEHGPVEALMARPGHHHLRSLIAALPNFSGAMPPAGAS